MGEFRKRIEKIWDDIPEGDGDVDFDPIYKLLVEAKKEFPLDVSYDHRYIKESLAWFEKWFGDGVK